MRRIGLAIAVVACALAPVRVRAGEEPFLVNRSARAHYELAGAHAGRGDLRAAAAELDAAHAIEPHPELLFVRAEVRRRLGECRTALTLYRDFIASRPSEAATRQAEAGITACEQTLAPTEPAPAPAPEPEPPPEPTPKPAAPPPPRWQRDPAGGVLLGLGVATLAAAGGLTVAATLATRGLVDELDTDYEARRSRAIGLQWGAGAAAAAGVGLAVGAALRYRAAERRSQRLGAWFDGHGVGLALRGRF